MTRHTPAAQLLPPIKSQEQADHEYSAEDRREDDTRIASIGWALAGLMVLVLAATLGLIWTAAIVATVVVVLRIRRRLA